MKKRDFSKKKKVIYKGDYDMLRGIMTEKAFFDTFIVCEKLVTRMLAEQAVAYVAFTDVSVKYINEQNKLN